MSKQQDGSVSGDDREEFTAIKSLTVEHLVRIASFPIYGLIDRPAGLTLKGIGYSTVDPDASQPDASQADALRTSSRPHVLWQASFRFERPSALQRDDQSIEVYSCNIHQSPMPAPPIANPDGANGVRYPSPHAVPEESTQERAFVIERFPLIDGIAVASIRFFAHPPLPGRLLGTHVHHSPHPPHPVSPRPAQAVPEWTFTMRGPEIWLGGKARGWAQSELFAVLGHLAAVNHRTEVLSQYERELLDWKRV